MGTIWTRELTGGLDSRRLPETAPGGVMIQAQDGHISRGGEFEKRAAFIPVYTLPTGKTKGLAATTSSLYVFGTDTPVTVPSGVLYQRINVPSSQPLVGVPSFDLFAGKLYVVGLYGDASLAHFYDGTRVTDWYDGRARGWFNIVTGGITPAVSAVGYFEVTAGSAGIGNQITDITIDGVSLISAPVLHTGVNSTTASAIATAITSNTSFPDYTATANGQTVAITAVTPGAAINGKAIIVTVGGTVGVSNVQNMSGGADTKTATITDVTVNGVSIIGSPVLWAGTVTATAAALASEIQSYVSSPNYDGTSVGNQVNITTVSSGATANGYSVVVKTANGMVISQPTTVMYGGSAGGAFTPGIFVKTFGSKVYALSGSNMHFSGIQQPTKWTTETTGAGFIDMSTQTSGSETLRAVAPYQGKLAVFAESAVQIEYVDPDPTLNTLSQVLSNTGTISGRSVTQFGDNDLFYCASNGLRSLRARNATVSAATTDIGVPVDDLIIAKLNTLTEQEKQQVIGLIEPRDGRFWLIMKDTIFVLSYFSGSKVSAWTTYKPGFNITDAVVFNRRVWVRSGDTIYAFGGTGDALVYDDTVAIAQMPYQDGDKPWEKKTWTGIDIAAKGVWEVYARYDPTDREGTDEQRIGGYDGTTYNGLKNPMQAVSSHISLIVKSNGDGYAKIGALAVHFAGGSGQDNDG